MQFSSPNFSMLLSSLKSKEANAGFNKLLPKHCQDTAYTQSILEWHKGHQGT